MIYILPTDTCFGLACPITEHKDYEKIYKIKKREFGKPLAILVPNLEWLEKYTILTKEQVDFLRKYKKAWTILTESEYVKIWLNFVNEETGDEFRNRWIYEKIAFRVAHNDIQKKLLKKEWPLFLTSANLSGKWEIYLVKEVKKEFKEYLEKWIAKLIWEELWDLDEKISPSEIFEFEWSGTNQRFIRK